MKASLLIKTSSAEDVYRYIVEAAKLRTQRIAPNPEALFSLNKSLVANISSNEYVFKRHLVKNLPNH